MCVCAVLATFGVAAGTATAAALSWSAPAGVAAGGYISCPSTSLCVTVGAGPSGSYAVTTTDPTAATPTWSTAQTINSGEEAISGVSCASTSLCAAVDPNGNAVITTDPTAATPIWSTPTPIDTGQEPTGVSCASTSLCVAVDNNGNAVITTDPTAATPTWSTAKTIDANTMAGGGFLALVSCPTTSLCVSTQAEGDVVVTNDPTAQSPAWTNPATIDTGHLLIGLSCTSTATLFCVATDNYGNIFVSTDPAANLWSSPVNAGGQAGVSCASTSLCVAIGGVSGPGLGSAVLSTNPTANTWGAPEQIDGNPLGAISCPSPTLCVAIDNAGNAVVGHGSSVVAKPTSISPPTISGHAVEGVTLTEVHGSWTSNPTSFGYQWEDCNSSGGSCTPISGANGQTHRLMSSDVGHTIRVIETATNTGGASAPATSVASGVVVQTTAPPAPPAAPKISAVSQSASKWTENNQLARISRARKLPVGTTFSLKLSEAARVSLAFTQSRAGRKVGKRCVAKTKHNARKSRCTRTVTVGTLTFAGHAGTIKVRFGGRVSKHLKLKPGAYTLVITATASKKASTLHKLHFTIA